VDKPVDSGKDRADGVLSVPGHEKGAARSRGARGVGGGQALAATLPEPPEESLDVLPVPAEPDLPDEPESLDAFDVDVPSPEDLPSPEDFPSVEPDDEDAVVEDEPDRESVR